MRLAIFDFPINLEFKVRPALVVSEPYGDEDRALIAVVPHTTSTQPR